MIDSTMDMPASDVLAAKLRAASDARRPMAESLIEVFERGAVPSIEAWARSNVQIKHAERRGEFVPTNLQVPILQALADWSVPEVTVMGPSQFGKTEPAKVFVAWVLEHGLGNVLGVMPTEADADSAFRDIWLPFFRGVPSLLAKMKSSRSVSMDRCRIDATTGTFALRGSDTTGGLESLSWPFVIMDEYELCGAAAEGKAIQRSKTFARSKVVRLGNPGDEGLGLHARWLEGDRGIWTVPCLYCGEWFSRQFNKHVRWGDRPLDSDFQRARPLQIDPAEARATAVIVCPKCRALLGAKEHLAMNARGLYLPAGCAVTPGGEVIGRRSQTDHMSFWAGGLDNELEGRGWPAGNLAAMCVRNRGRFSREETTRNLGMVYRAPAESLKADELARCVRGPGAGPLGGGGKIEELRASIGTRAVPAPRGAIPAWVCWVLTTIDVQVQGVWHLTLGWSRDWASALVIDFGYIAAPERADAPERMQLRPVDHLLDRWWRREDGKHLPTFLTGIDCGDREPDVFAFARRVGPQRCRPVRGDQRVGTWWVRAVDKGDPKDASVLRVCHFSSGHFKDRLATMLRTSAVSGAVGSGGAGGPGAVGGDETGLGGLEDAGGGAGGGDGGAVATGERGEVGDAASARSVADLLGALWLPEGLPLWWWDHLTSERKITVTNRKGQATRMWVAVDGKPNHLWDALYYNVALAAYVRMLLLQAPREPRMITLSKSAPPGGGAAEMVKSSHGQMVKSEGEVAVGSGGGAARAALRANPSRAVGGVAREILSG